MMAAAQAAAEAALREAAAREAGNQEQQQQSEQDVLSNLFQQQQAPFQQGATNSEATTQLLLNEMMGGAADANASNVESLLEIMAQQEQIAALEAQRRARPRTHYLTVSQDGTILEATETVTGFPPDALMMTSWYDAVYDEDLPGFLGVKTHFWDQGRPDIDLYIRRQTLEGDWIWLRTRVIEFVEQPVKGYIVHEEVEEDESTAIRINRITRIAAILVQAVEAAEASKPKTAPAGMLLGASSALGNQEIPLVADDAAAYQAWLQLAQSGGGTASSENPATDALQSIMNAASTGGAAVGAATSARVGGVGGGGESKQEPETKDTAISQLQSELMKNSSDERKSFDPMSALKAVKTGVCLDLGMIRLAKDEVKLITLVLTGRITVQEVGPLILEAMKYPGRDLSVILNAFVTESERQQLNPFARTGQAGSRIRSGGRSTSSSELGSSAMAQRVGSFPDLNRGTSWPAAGSFPMRSSGSLPSYGSVPNFPPVRPPSPTHTCPVDKLLSSAAIGVLNLSYTYMGNAGIEMLSEILYLDNSQLQTLDVSFCSIEEKGLLAFARALNKRKQRRITPLKGLVLSGNYISYRAAKDLGLALSPSDHGSMPRKRSRRHKTGGGYEEDTESDDDDDDEDDDGDFGTATGLGKKRSSHHMVGSSKPAKKAKPCCSPDDGLQVLHLAACSLSGEALFELLQGLGPHCPIQELSIPSNKIGPSGATLLVEFMEQKTKNVEHPVMPFLDRLDLTNNDLGNDGTARLTRAISKRLKIHFVDLRLSCNEIGSAGVETVMNKLLQHNIISLSLDKNNIGDQGCQLVAASIQSMHLLSRLNLSFNQIGSRGVNSLMKTLIGCDSITYLGLSGNIMKISGATAMGFTLAQHPRLEELDLDNCCLSQASQCHIVAGIISNRWVPMKVMNGFQAGPPMAAIGALDVFAHNLSNEECFRLRRDEQMKTILQWMESNRSARESGRESMSTDGSPSSEQQYLTPEFVSTMNDVQGSPSQNAYLRMLGWLSKIPFDEDELTSLRKYFFDIDGGDGDRGSDGYINLKLRGDLLAALDSEVADEIRDTGQDLELNYKGSVGIDLDTLPDLSTTSSWGVLRGNFKDKMPVEMERTSPKSFPDPMEDSEGSIGERAGSEDKFDINMDLLPRGPVSLPTKGSQSGESKQSVSSSSTSERKGKPKERITMFPAFEQKLEELKASAKELVDNEPDPDQQDVILTQYAEASLTILRQLRYHCMNSGLDGWRQGGLKRKVLVVDDSLVTRKMVSRAFEKANFIVDTAENGVEGVKKLKESIYDIAFMDIDMPIMNGFEATKALRQWEDTQRPGARQPICALTAAYVDDFERSELMKFKEAGLDVMESKPCNIPRLFKVVDDVSPMFSDLSISVSQGLPVQ